MMNIEKLYEIKQNIYQNFGKELPEILTTAMNCYMFAVFCTIPTEQYQGEINGQILLRSLIGEEIAYFGSIGSFSHTTFWDKESLIFSVRSDLECLGFSVRSSWKNDIQPNEVAIIFYYDLQQLQKGKIGKFHFIRQDKSGIWWQKNGWTGDIGIVKPTEVIQNGFDFVEHFYISLKEQ